MSGEVDDWSGEVFFRVVVLEQFVKSELTSYANVGVLDRVVAGKDIAL